MNFSLAIIHSVPIFVAMPRKARIVAPDLPHHVTQRGNRRMPVFFKESDYALYKQILSESCHKSGVTIWAYCLMPNHVHFIAVPQSTDALACVFREAHRRYTAFINKREGWTGHLWQDRFSSFIMDEPHTLMAARYIENNPVSAKICHSATDYLWSSAQAHIAGNDDGLVEARPLLDMAPDWGTFLKQSAPSENALLERHQASGFPLGERSFIQKLETQLSAKLCANSRGRPIKTGTE